MSDPTKVSLPEYKGHFNINGKEFDAALFVSKSQVTRHLIQLEGYRAATVITFPIGAEEIKERYEAMAKELRCQKITFKLAGEND